MLKNSTANRQWAAAGFLAALILLIILVRDHQKDHLPPDPTPMPVIVDIQGDIKIPGVHMLPGPSATVETALKASGGIPGLGPADIIADSQNSLSKEVHTGERVLLTRGAEGGLQVETGLMQAAARITLGLKLDLNTAGVEELCAVPQMKPELAAAIVGRRSQAPWRDVQELTEISGVGPKTVKKWSEYLEVAAGR